MDDELEKAQYAARMLPPLRWGEWAVCVSPNCGARTAAYLHLADGQDRPICGACYAKEMDRVIREWSEGEGNDGRGP